MKTITHITLFMIISFTALNLAAQITIQKMDFPINTQNDTFNIIINPDSLSKPDRGSDLKWNYSMITDTSSFIRSYIAPDNAHFPGSDRQTYFEILIGPGISLDIWQQYENTDDGFNYSGLYSPADTFPLGQVTFNNNDTFYWHEQIITEPLMLLGYPLEENAVFTSEATHQLDFTISLAMFGFNRSPGNLITHYNLIDSVVAWGSLRLPFNDSGTTKEIEVLLLKRYFKTIDSIYIDDEPAPGAFLTMTGMTQGEISEAWTYVFYRKGYGSELLYLNCDNMECDQIISGYYDSQGLEEEPSVSVDNIFTQKDLIFIYPTLVKNNQIYINVTPDISGGVFTIYDVHGRTIQEEVLSKEGSHMVILDSQIQSGIYIYSISGENYIYKSKLIVK